jgi:hypothetical protein
MARMSRTQIGPGHEKLAKIISGKMNQNIDEVSKKDTFGL